MIPKIVIERHLRNFLEEDLATGDVTSALIPDGQTKAKIQVKEAGVVAGIEVAKVLFEMMGVFVIDSVPDGSAVRNRQDIMSFEGKARNILMVERTALNIVGTMSGIATATKEMVEKARKVNPSIKIAATRKTTPGFRIFEKMAVAIAGGDPHRFSTGDAVLIKDNHLRVIGGVNEALQRARSSSFTRKIEIEVRSVDEAVEASKNADIIMFDNMSPEEIKKAVEEIKRLGLRKNVLFEASGDITPANVEEYAKTNVDVISSGYITHSAKALNMSMYICGFGNQQ